MKKYCIASSLFVAWLIIMIFLISLSLKCERQCYDCQIIIIFPEIHKSLDTTITICDIQEEYVEEFEDHNTYFDTTLSDFDTYQFCKCKEK
jgi:hypothetical protein